MAGQYRIDFSILGATGGGVSAYIPVPFDCKILGMQASPDADPGDAETLTLSEDSQTIGVLTFGSDIAAGATGTYAADSTYGTKQVNAGDVLKITCSTLTAAATFKGYIDIDPYCVG